MMYANMNTKECVYELPKQIGATWNPTFEQLAAIGWRAIVEIEQPEPGNRIVSQVPVELDSTTCKLIITEQVNIAAEHTAAQAAAQAAKLATLTPALMQQAGLVRATLAKYFGAGAEINPSVTYDTVASYFIAKQAAGTITVQELADSIVLKELFSIICAWTGDGTIWSFPWVMLSV